MASIAPVACPTCKGPVERVGPKLNIKDLQLWLQNFDRTLVWNAGIMIPLAILVLAVLWWPGAVISLAILGVGWIATASRRATYECPACKTAWSFEEARLGRQRRDA